MDTAFVVDAAFKILLLLTGGLVKVLWDAVKSLQSDLKKIEVALPTHYVHKDEFRQGVQEIKDMLNKISDKLDAKADK